MRVLTVSCSNKNFGCMQRRPYVTQLAQEAMKGFKAMGKPASAKSIPGDGLVIRGKAIKGQGGSGFLASTFGLTKGGRLSTPEDVAHDIALLERVAQRVKPCYEPCC